MDYWLKTNLLMGASPSPALMKAYLIAHATYLTGANADDDLPGEKQGYGLPNLDAMTDSSARFLVDQTIIYDSSGAGNDWFIKATDSDEPVRIVMAYSDAPGAVGSTSPQLNDLNLRVAIDGLRHYGNDFDHQWSVSGGPADADAANNYEAVFLDHVTYPNLDTSGFVLTIEAFQILGDGVPEEGGGDPTDQDFALVCNNCEEAIAPDCPPIHGCGSGCTVNKLSCTVTGTGFQFCKRPSGRFLVCDFGKIVYKRNCTCTGEFCLNTNQTLTCL